MVMISMTGNNDQPISIHDSVDQINPVGSFEILERIQGNMDAHDRRADAARPRVVAELRSQLQAEHPTLDIMHVPDRLVSYQPKRAEYDLKPPVRKWMREQGFEYDLIST